MIAPSDATRKLMQHSALDTFDVQEFKRLWWNLSNVTRACEFLDDEGHVSAVMHDLESIVSALTQ